MKNKMGMFVCNRVKDVMVLTRIVLGQRDGPELEISEREKCVHFTLFYSYGFKLTKSLFSGK